MPLRMPVLCQEKVCPGAPEPFDQRVDRRDDGIAIRYRKRAAREKNRTEGQRR